MDNRPGQGLKYPCWGDAEHIRRPTVTDCLPQRMPGQLRYGPAFEAHCDRIARDRAEKDLERRMYAFEQEKARLLKQYEQAARNDRGGRI